MLLSVRAALSAPPRISSRSPAPPEKRHPGIVPAESQRIRRLADIIGNTIDHEALQFLRSRRSIRRTGHDPGPGLEGLRDRGAVRLVGQGEESVCTARPAAAAYRDGPIHGLGGIHAIAQDRDRRRRRRCRAAFCHVDGLDVIVVQGRIVLHQRIQVMVVVRDPIGAHGGRGIRDLRRPIAVIGPVLVDRLQDFIVRAVNRSPVDFRAFIVGEDADFIPDDIEIRRIDGRPGIGIPAERVIPREFRTRRGSRHKAQGEPFVAGAGVPHIGVSVGVRDGMVLPAGIVDDIVPAAGHARPAAGAHALEGRSGNPVQGLAGVGGSAAGRNEGRNSSQDIRRLVAAAGITDVIVLAGLGKGRIFAAFRTADDIPLPDPPPLAVYPDPVIRGTIDDPVFPAGITRRSLESHILVLLDNPCRRLCRQRGGNACSQRQKPCPQGAGCHDGSRFPAAQRSLAIPAGQFRHDDITVAHTVPNDLINFVHTQTPPVFSSKNPACPKGKPRKNGSFSRKLFSKHIYFSIKSYFFNYIRVVSKSI